MRDGEGRAPRLLPQNLRSDFHAFSQDSLGWHVVKWAGLVSPGRFRFLFPLNRSLPASATGLSRFPGLSGSLAPARPSPSPAPRPRAPRRAREGTLAAQRDSSPAGTAESRARRDRRAQWPAQGPPLRAGASASLELPSRGWGQRCCFSPTGCCSGRRCPEYRPCWCPPRCRCSGSGWWA